MLVVIGGEETTRLTQKHTFLRKMVVFNNLLRHLSYSVENTIQQWFFLDPIFTGSFPPSIGWNGCTSLGERANVPNKFIFHWPWGSHDAFQCLVQLRTFERLPRSVRYSSLSGKGGKTGHLVLSDAPESTNPSVPLHSVHNITKNQHLLCLSSLDFIPGKTEWW